MENRENKTGILYCRVSTLEQGQYGFSIPAQQEQLEKYCQHREIKILKIYKEKFSAKDFNRPVFNQLLEYARKNYKLIDFLIFTKWDRLSRNTLEFLIMKQHLNKLGIKLIAVEQDFDESVPESQLMINMLSSMAEIERLRIGSRTRDGMHQAMKQGHYEPIY